MEEYAENHQRQKYPRLLQHPQPSDLMNSDPHRVHTTLEDPLKIKGCVEGHTDRATTTECDPKQSSVVATTECLPPDKRVMTCTEKSSDTQKKDAVNLEGRRGHHLEPDLLGAEAQVILHSGSSRSLLNKIAGVRAEKTPVVDQEKGGGMEEVLDVTEDMENEIKTALGPGPKKEILSSVPDTLKLLRTAPMAGAARSQPSLGEEVILTALESQAWNCFSKGRFPNSSGESGLELPGMLLLSFHRTVLNILPPPPVLKPNSCSIPTPFVNHYHSTSEYQSHRPHMHQLEEEAGECYLMRRLHSTLALISFCREDVISEKRPRGQIQELGERKRNPVKNSTLASNPTSKTASSPWSGHSTVSSSWFQRCFPHFWMQLLDRAPALCPIAPAPVPRLKPPRLLTRELLVHYLCTLPWNAGYAELTPLKPVKPGSSPREVQDHSLWVPSGKKFDSVVVNGFVCIKNIAHKKIATMAENGDNEKMAVLEAKICHQIEYYFGGFNFPQDKFLKEQIKIDEVWVPLDIMIKFNKLNQLTTDFNGALPTLNVTPAPTTLIYRGNLKNPELPVQTADIRKENLLSLQKVLGSEVTPISGPDESTSDTPFTHQRI
ncbi:hypothetical protein A6R68_10296, partial [Neotoma lepida]